MTGPIKAGDLVVVTRPALCCGAKENVGTIFTVESVSSFDTTCAFCDGLTGNFIRAIKVGKNGKRASYGLHRLTRIDPLPESETHRDEVTA